MPVKFGKTSKQIDRQTKKVSIVHEYMKCQSVNTLIEKYNNSSTTKKLKRKIKVEFDRRKGRFTQPQSFQTPSQS